MKDSFTKDELEALFGSSKLECARAKFFLNKRADGTYKRKDILDYARTISKSFQENMIVRMIRGKYRTVEIR